MVWKNETQKARCLSGEFRNRFANGDMSREDFDLDYSGYVIDYFPEFEREHPRLARRFVDAIERTYSACF